MVQLSLKRQGDPLSAASRQLQVLHQVPHRSFATRLRADHAWPLKPATLEILQVNLGRMCNQTCRHCHVDAGPDRREIMTSETVDACLRVLEQTQIRILDLTGGAPEMNPQFRRLVTAAARLGCRILDRCNLTILRAPGYQDLPEFLAEHRVEVIASLPCYLESNTDAQRGDGVFARSLEALHRLNELGYGVAGSGLSLSLVFNPHGPQLPPPQAKLEEAYRTELKARYGVVFNRLITITNMPISRFLADLISQGRLEEYLQRLIDAYNPATVEHLMCRNTLSVGWDGRLYDCDFNQMLDLELTSPAPRTIYDFDEASLQGREIVLGPHCFGCTAGAGSSCQGAVT